MKNILKNIFTQPNLWGGVLPLQILGVYAIYITCANQAPSNWFWLTCIGYVCIMMLGVSAGYHRLLSHKGFEVHSFVKKILLWFAAISAQGSPIFWVTVHRGYHHRYSDKERDPHSPKQGFWHSYILWMFKLKEGDVNTKYIVDLLRDKDVMFFHKHYNKILWMSHLIIATISIEFWLWAVILPSFITFHSFSFQTSMNHSKLYGYKNYETSDDSVNVIWLFPFILGEAWHNNHHGDAKNPNYGSRRWWEIDPTFWLIKLFRTG
jgi:fatty-acid desaturase